jgi:hypothetical protein
MRLAWLALLGLGGCGHYCTLMGCEGRVWIETSRPLSPDALVTVEVSPDDVRSCEWSDQRGPPCNVLDSDDVSLIVVQFETNVREGSIAVEVDEGAGNVAYDVPLVWGEVIHPNGERCDGDYGCANGDGLLVLTP